MREGAKCSRMRILYILLGLTFSLQAEDTNVISTFRVGETLYRNVTVSKVTALDAIILFEGGGAKVPLSNCPAWFQERYGYDPKAATEAIQRNTAAKKPIRATQPRSATAEILGVTILEVTGYSPYLRCFAIGGNGGEMFISGLPPEVTKFLKSINDLENAIGVKRTQIDLDESGTYDTAFNIPFPGETMPKMVLEKRKNITPADLERDKKELEKLEAKLEMMESQRALNASVYLQYTGQSYAKVPIYRCVGKPKASLPEKNLKQVTSPSRTNGLDSSSQMMKPVQ